MSTISLTVPCLTSQAEKKGIDRPPSHDVGVEFFSSNEDLIDREKQYILPIYDSDNNKHHKRNDIIISIRPTYAEKIFQGIKTIELRRRFPRFFMKNTVAYIYATSPEMALIGVVQIEKVEYLDICFLWAEYGKYASITKSDFDKYFNGLKQGYALKLSTPRRFFRPLTLLELKDRFHFNAPQSFLYVRPNLHRALQDEYAKILD